MLKVYAGIKFHVMETFLIGFYLIIKGKNPFVTRSKTLLEFVGKIYDEKHIVNAHC